jgi:hypothetical protein
VAEAGGQLTVVEVKMKRVMSPMTKRRERRITAVRRRPALRSHSLEGASLTSEP